ncbi:MAG: cyclic nucleotide-binding domain-containing protein, partial [Leptospiraceae bacterium]|nr:cyclic nucleotide-binding domain-containing protein [Leptospiraceae bacterium]
MAVDTSKVNQKITVNAGEVLFSEGSIANSLNILHEGSIVFEKKIKTGNFPLFQITGVNLTPGAIALFTSGRYPYTIKAAQNCVISTYSVNPATIRKTISGKVSLGITVARTILREVLESYKKINQIQLLDSKVAQYSDNLSITYYAFSPSVFPDISPEKPVPSPAMEIHDSVMKFTRDNIKEFFERGGRLPEPPSVAFLNEPHDQFARDYSEEVDFDDKEFIFMKKLLSTDPKIQSALFEADVSLLVYACEKLSEVYSGIFNSIDEKTDALSLNCGVFLGGNESLLEKFFLLLDLAETGFGDAKPEILVPITEHISEKAAQILSQFKNLFGVGYSNLSPNIQKFKEKSTKLFGTLKPIEIQTKIETNVGAGIDVEAIRKELESSANKIINFAGLAPDKVKEFSALMIKLKQMKDPLDPDSDARKFRRNITKTYWEIYQSCFIKYLNQAKKAPKPVEMMLQFGFFDETLLDNDQLAYLYTSSDYSKSKENTPVWYGQEWLEKIYKKEVPNSLDELGQTYFDKVKLTIKDTNIKKESDLPASMDTNEARLKFELLAMYEPNVKLTSGSIATHLPILTRNHIILPLDKCRITKKLISDEIEEILKIDYTAFNREIIFNNEELGIRKEFVQRSITPDFVIVPSIGSKVMMWQDLSILRGSGSKESRGRIILPMFVTGDLKTMLMEAIAVFRWELCKNILGPDWNNVGIPSITSEYMDYIQFFKKSKDLSIELKEKIASEFKRFRTDRDKFVNDYLYWVKYESEGVQRLNRVVRNIFYRHIPFTKVIRDK